MRVFHVAAMLVAMAATPAWAQQQSELASFSVGTVKFIAPVPAGYCLPQGEEVARAEKMAAFDDYNDSKVTLMSCGDAADPLTTAVIKTPKHLVSQRITLAEALNNSEFDVAAKAGGDGLDSEMESVTERETGMEVDVTGVLRGLGRDDQCGYLGGTVQVDAVIVSVVVCTTVVGERLLYVIFTTPGSDPQDIPRLKAKSRAFAATIRATGN